MFQQAGIFIFLCFFRFFFDKWLLEVKKMENKSQSTTFHNLILTFGLSVVVAAAAAAAAAAAQTRKPGSYRRGKIKRKEEKTNEERRTPSQRRGGKEGGKGGRGRGW